MSIGFTPVTPEQSLADTQAIFTDTFGSGVNLNPTSINGIFIQQLTNLNINVNNIQTVLYGGLYNPDIASGIYLDSICALLDLSRIPATSSRATCEVTGLVGTVIPIGSQIINDAGYIFELIDDPITITGNPSIDTGLFAAIDVGLPIPVSAGTITGIVQQIAGWDTVINPDDGIIGKPSQTDTSLRYTRTQALAINATGTIDALISGAIKLMPNTITDFIVLQNPTATSVVKNGITLDAYSIYLGVVQIGNDDDISALLYQKKPPGTVMTGSYTPPLYTDPKYSWETFQAYYTKATIEQVVIAIDITNNSYPAGTAAKVQAAILDAFDNGTIGNPPINMRSGTIYASRFIGSVEVLGITTINTITITTVALNTPGSTLTLPANQAPALQLNNIIVTGIS